jgi:hypothetical protein
MNRGGRAAPGRLRSCRAAGRRASTCSATRCSPAVVSARRAGEQSVLPVNAVILGSSRWARRRYGHRRTRRPAIPSCGRRSGCPSSCTPTPCAAAPAPRDSSTRSLSPGSPRSPTPWSRPTPTNARPGPTPASARPWSAAFSWTCSPPATARGSPRRTSDSSPAHGPPLRQPHEAADAGRHSLDDPHPRQPGIEHPAVAPPAPCAVLRRARATARSE